MPRAGDGLRLLLLGGTAEARELAGRLAAAPEIRVVTSLAGRTRTPMLPAGECRIGGFGGIDGLCDWLRCTGTGLVVDATHPFARRISAHALAACRRLGLPCLRLERPPWRPAAGDRWREVPSLERALEILPASGRRVFASVGREQIPRLAERPECRFLLRAITPPAAVPANVEVVTGRPPYTVAGDRSLLARFAIDALLVRNSGGAGARPKLLAARELGLPVVMIARPPPLPGNRVTSVEAAVEAVLAYSRGRAEW